MAGDESFSPQASVQGYTEEELNAIQQRMSAAAAEIESEERNCRIGDLLKVMTSFEVNDWDENTESVANTGQIYKAINLFGRGWDLRLISGIGPENLRVMDSDIPALFKVMPGQP